MPRLAPSFARQPLIWSAVVLMLAALPGLSQDDRDPSQPPARDPQIPAATPNVRPTLEITDLRAGSGPYVWLQPERIASTFITNSAIGLEVTVGAHIDGRPELDKQIEWEITPPAGFVATPGPKPKGSKVKVRFSRAKGNPTGAGDALEIGVLAKVALDGGVTLRAPGLLRQDLRDRLRQEYVDLERTDVPNRSDFLDAGQYADRFGAKYPNIEFSELNWSKQPGLEERYPFILADEALVRALARAERLYERPLVISSAYRNPVRQLEIHASVEESHHQYGRAADLYVVPDYAEPHNGRKLANEMDWLWLAGPALRGGGTWIEPLLQSGPNTDLCHVHVDVRGGGPRSQIVELRGALADSTKTPVAGATLTMAGMTTSTNAQGRFMLRHVLTPGQYIIEARGSTGVASQMVNIGPKLDTVSLVLPGGTAPSLTAMLVKAERYAAGGLEALINVKNIGEAEARSIKLAAISPMEPSAVGKSLPELLSSLAPQAEMAFRVQIPLTLPEPDPTGTTATPSVPLEVTLTYSTPSGDVRTGKTALNATPASASIGSGGSETGLPELPDGVQKAPKKGVEGFLDTDVGVTVGIVALCLILVAVFAMTRKKPEPIRPVVMWPPSNSETHDPPSHKSDRN